MGSTITVLTALVALAIGSGTGGIVGAVIMVRRFKVEQEAAKTQGHIGLREVDVEQFKAMFPGGLGDAVEHWRNEAKNMMTEVTSLREIERQNYGEILILQTELDRTKASLKRTQKDLERANGRIEHLEQEREQGR